MIEHDQMALHPLCVLVVDDKAVYADRVKDAISSESPSGLAAKWEFPDCTAFDPRESLAKVMRHWDEEKQFFLVILDLHWDFQLPDSTCRATYCGLEYIYEKMNQRWRTSSSAGLALPRPWRHVFIRSKLAGAIETDQHAAEIERLCNKNVYCIPQDHRYRLDYSNDDANLHRLARDTSRLAKEYLALVEAGRAAEFDCDCLP